MPVPLFAGEAHSALAGVRAALTDHRAAPGGPVADLRHLEARLGAAWRVRHSSPDHRTRLGALLPGLIRDAQAAVRSLTGQRRRHARRILGGVYQLTDLYVAHQPAPELVWLVADRAVTEGQEADDPYSVAAGSWALVQALRDSGSGYRHVQTSFSAPVVRAHATTLAVDLRRPAEALRASAFEPDDIPSVPRRARHLIEVARAHDQRGDRHAALALLTVADRTAPETARYNRHARTMALDLVDRPPTGARHEVRALATDLRLLAG